MWKALLISAFAAGLVLVAAKDTERASRIVNNNASDSVIDTVPTQDTADFSDTQGTSDISSTLDNQGTSGTSSTLDTEEGTSNTSSPLDNQGISDTSSTDTEEGTSNTSSILDNQGTSDTSSTLGNQGTSATSSTSNTEGGTSDNSSTSDSEEDTSNSSNPSDTEGSRDTSSTLNAQSSEADDDDTGFGCNGDPNAEPGCGVNCGRTCSTYQRSDVGCAAICYLNACDCKKGFVFDDVVQKCVLPAECSPVCGPNEIVSNCSNGGCGPFKCTDLGKPLICIDVANCTKGCVCQNEYLRADNGTCVPKDQCPGPCGGDPNAKPGCGVNCGKTCSTYKVKHPICPRICKVNGCDCKDNFVFDEVVQKCVLPADCSPVCGPNEIVSNCSNGGCGPFKCTDLSKPLICIDVANCTKGCVCQNEYLRADNGTCVPKDQCPGSCGGDPNAKPGCGVNCGKTCTTYRVKHHICPTICKVNGCDCKDNFVFDPNVNKCVSPTECTRTCGANYNEVFSACINDGCDARNCSQVGKPVPCVKLDPKSCIKGCVCDSGFLRASNGTCVPTNQCGAATCTGQNEMFDECIHGCSNQTCADIGQIFHCPFEPASCRTGCRCKPGFWRNSDNVCIPESQCPIPTCHDREIYSRCPTVQCEGDYCPKTRNSPLNCPVGVVCDPPRCVCGFNSHRDRKTGKCIATADCPPFACNGPNEEYQPCPPVCPGENCSVYINNATCPRFRIGIVVPCTPQCKCKKGYYRNADGVCIIGSKCETGSCGGDPNAKPGCGVNCGKTCSTYKIKNPFCPTICKVNGCDCKDGFVFDPNLQKCVQPEDCTPTCGANEVFSTCINGGCGARNCSQVGRSGPCVDPKVCVKGCVCDTGYLRASNGTCVPKDQCGGEGGCGGDPNAEPGCGTNCGKTCTSCKSKPGACPDVCVVGGCDCKKGFVFDSIVKKCVLPADCSPPPCPEGEIYNKCPTVKCEGDYCPLTRDSPLTCPVGIVCDPPRCVCGFNSHRDRKTGKCIATADCPPFACNGPNEEYQPCPPVCPGENCTDYINDTRCPRFRIGIVVPCTPQCKCKKGYYRNADGVCIIGYQCGPKKSSTTTTTTTTSTPTTTTTTTTTTKAPPATGANIASLQAGISDFSGKCLYDRMQASKGQNVIISAFSVFILLAQLALYATGDSLKQLLTVLHANSPDDIRTNFPALTASYEGQESVIFSLADKVYSNLQYKLSDRFKNDTVNVFNAESQEINFNDSSKAADTINQWVASKTNNRITDLVSSDMFSKDTRIVLVDAIFFKGSWLYQFDAKNTQDQPFYLEDGTNKTTKLMYQEATLKYGEVDDLGCKVIEMMYKGRNFSMVVVLPNYINGVTTLAQKLQDSSLFDKVIGTLRSQKVKVWLPKFETKTKTDLPDILKKQYVTKIFDSVNAGLEGILAEPRGVYISKAVQDADIVVNEEGSEAAAATGVIGLPYRPGPPPPPPKEFRADHGFLYYLRVNSVTVFCGAYVG